MKTLYSLRLLAICLLLSNSIFSQWVQKASYTGVRDGAVSWLINGKFYQVGGNGKQDLQRYDPSTNTWSVMANIPQGATGFAMGFVINGKGYLCGGVNASFQYLGSLWEYDPALNQWTSRTPLPSGQKLANGIGFAVGGKGYVGCGDDGNFLYADMYQYDPGQNNWTPMLQFNGGYRVFPYCFTIRDTAYVGGGAGSGQTQYNDLWRYDEANDNWIQRSNLPGAPRQAATSFASDSNGYVGLGQSLYSSTFNEVFKYEPTTDTWDTLPRFNHGGRAWPIGFAYNNNVYLGGGWNFTTFYRDLYVYGPQVTVGLKSTETNTYALFPNPAQDELHLSFKTNTIADVTLVNSVGEEVKKIKITNETQSTLNLVDLAPGVYILKVKEPNGNCSSRKIIHTE